MAFLEKRGGLVPVYVFIFPANGPYKVSKKRLHREMSENTLFREGPRVNEESVRD